MDPYDAITYSLVALGSLVLVVGPFLRRYRAGSFWLRVGMFVGALLSLAWSGVGFYLLTHQIHGKTSLPWAKFWALDHLKSNISGIAVGLLATLMLSPEARRLSRRSSASNHALEATATRFEK